MALKVLTRLPSPRMAEAELTHLARVPIDMALAIQQHAAYCTALSATGAEVVVLPALDGYPDCTFVEDVLISLPEISILTRPGAESRRGEVMAIQSALPADLPVAHIVTPGTVDGGDVLLIGKTLYVGLSTRTNHAGIAQLVELAQPFGYKIITVEVPGALHLKTAVTALSSDLILINPAWIDADAFGDQRRVVVHPQERFAGNSLSVGDRIFMQAVHPETARRVAAAGFAIEMLEISEFAKAEAGLTCMSVVMKR